MKTIPAGLKPASSLLPGIALIAATLILAACGGKPQPLSRPRRRRSPSCSSKNAGRSTRRKGVEQTEAKSAEDLKREEEKQTK